MFSWISSKKKKPQTKVIKRPFFKPVLESLEDRVVMDALQWSPVNGLNWGTKENWFDFTTHAVATAPPTINDDVTFDGIDTWNSDCNVTSAAVCKSLTATNRYTKGLDLSGGSLTVNSNRTNAFSDWEGGYINSLTAEGTLFVQENFTYNVEYLNSPGGQRLKVVIGVGNPYFYLGQNCTSVYANFRVGENGWGVMNTGTMVVQTTLGSTFIGSPIYVSPLGSLSFNSLTSITGAGNINSGGHIYLGDGTTVGLSSGNAVNCLSGTLETVGGAHATIIGDVDMWSNSVLKLGTGSGEYATLNIVAGGLTFNGRTTYQYHVNGASPNECNQVTALAVYFAAGATVTSQCYTDGVNLDGDHSYIPLKTTVGIARQFLVYQWLGNGKVWDWSYATGDFVLTGTT